MRRLAAANPAGVLMRVLLISEVYPPAIGGPSEQSRQIAKELSSRGHSVLVATRTADPARDPEIPVVLIGGGRRGSIPAKLRGNIALLREIRGLIRAFRPDVIHAQSPGYPALFAVHEGRDRRIPTLVKYSGSAMLEANPGGTDSLRVRIRSGMLRLRERTVLRTASCVWATTPLYAERLHEDHHVARERFWVRPNFVDLSRFEPPPAPVVRDRIVLLVLARLKPHKGIDVAIEALSRLSRGRYLLRIAGDGPPEYESVLRRRASELGLRDTVDFVGAVPPDSVPDLFGTSDILLVPSLEEAFGIVLLEAMAAGVPVIGSDVGGIPYVLEGGRFGSLVPPGDAAALATAIDALSDDPELRRERVRAGRERAKQFDLTRGIDDLIEQYLRMRGSPYSAGKRG